MHLFMLHCDRDLIFEIFENKKSDKAICDGSFSHMIVEAEIIYRNYVSLGMCNICPYFSPVLQ